MLAWIARPHISKQIHGLEGHHSIELLSDVWQYELPNNFKIAYVNTKDSSFPSD